jgi:hypothetical protein
MEHLLLHGVGRVTLLAVAAGELEAEDEDGVRGRSRGGGGWRGIARGKGPVVKVPRDEDAVAGAEVQLLGAASSCLLATHGRGNSDASSDGAEDGRGGRPD